MERHAVFSRDVYDSILFYSILFTYLYTALFAVITNLIIKSSAINTGKRKDLNRGEVEA